MTTLDYRALLDAADAAARNAYAHVSFDGYDGPVTHPPLEVVHRLERILASLRSPA